MWLLQKIKLNLRKVYRLNTHTQERDREKKGARLNRAFYKSRYHSDSNSQEDG